MCIMDGVYTIGDRIKKLRQGRNLTQLILAKRLGVTKALISAYENQTAYPSIDVLLGLASIFNVTTDYLLGKEKTMNVSTTGLTESQIEFVTALVSEFQKSNKLQSIK
jgi:transcriptional regulator with XRE-family HTH domain